MRNVFQNITLMVAVLAGVALTMPRPALAQGTPLYSTGFESPGFLPGLLVGQQAFRVDPISNSSAATVIKGFASSGAQAMRINGSDVGLFGADSYSAFYFPPLNYDPLGMNLPLVIAQVDVALHAVGSEPTGAGLQFFDRALNSMGYFQINEDGSVIATNDDGDELDSSTTLDTYHTLATVLNFAKATTEYFLDGSSLGTLPFSSGSGSNLADADLYLYAINRTTCIGYFDNYQISAAETNTTVVTGRVDLPNCVASSGVPITFAFRPINGSVPFSQTVALTAQGTFLLTGIPKGAYQLAVKGSKWLQQVVSVDTSGGAVSGVGVTLIPGDANGDNYVGLDDMGLLADAFDTKPGDALWNAQADFNCDGVVGLDDLGLLALYFDTAGDP